MTQSDTPERLIKEARDRGKVLRCVPNGGDAGRIDFVRIHGSVLTDRYAGYVPSEEAAHVYHPDDVLERLRDTLNGDGEVLKVSQENTRWGEFHYGSD